jgi:mannose-6-phosphate isomerase-like protein (cupin superfamily)
MVKKITEPTRIPVPGGKLIEEFVGRVHTGTVSMSVAHMVAPPGWDEPFQTPDFDEVTIVLRGTMRVEHGEGITDVGAGETVLVEAGEPIRYSNPSAVEAEYWAVCAPAFSPETVHREGENDGPAK